VTRLTRIGSAKRGSRRGLNCPCVCLSVCHIVV